MLYGAKLALLGTVISTIASSAYAHMILANPIPFGPPGNTPLDNAPLDPQGSNFPCKQRDGDPYVIQKMNYLAVGSQQTLSFSGTAVHSGGSCQLAVSLDREPTKSSKWKVIYSIEGGCPGVGGAATTFPFTVPKELPNGQATFAWLWWNHSGNREIYMNCAPITVSGGSEGQDDFNQLPDVVFVNLVALNTCKNHENFDYIFENPGEYKTKIGSGPFEALCPGGAAGQLPASQTPASQALSVPSAPVIPSQAPTPSSAPISAPPNIASTVHTLVTVTAPTSGASSVTPSAAPPVVPSAPPATPGGGSTCSTDGALVCNGEDQFGLCNHGKVVFQPIAAGTRCQNGRITKRYFAHRAQRAHL
ncbi:uncharacterized protein BDR25DRAFT_384675 [Lindgomyces ingoldianus]|uniref:Uncharacterized protein n=1 Tax=Lindgomyces ingoldianus TaxID=673940 RepID=A0ACB6Q8Z2_9PLEO|nr:uncharacterized protein BDR25DRAFT_384675 [Lindgomyces ingoldianus]KAF2463374.1 hypothetical protein BDR25DRAFT_384675 [Lindgomyces ingoldianus]